MTKRGNLDNVVTYEHICDTSADMNNIDPQYVTLGSVCIVINGEDEGMNVYMANSNKEWVSIAMSSGGSSGGSGSSGVMVVEETYNELSGFTTLNKTWQEIHDAMNGGKLVVIQDIVSENDGFYQLTRKSAFQVTCDPEAEYSPREGLGPYRVCIYNFVMRTAFYYVAETADNYPVYGVEE